MELNKISKKGSKPSSKMRGKTHTGSREHLYSKGGGTETSSADTVLGSTATRSSARPWTDLQVQGDRPPEGGVQEAGGSSQCQYHRKQPCGGEPKLHLQSQRERPGSTPSQYTPCREEQAVQAQVEAG